MRPNIRQVGGANSPEEWFHSLPPITRWWLVLALLSTLLTSLGVLDVRLIVLNLTLVQKKFQIWRLITGFTYFGGFGMNFVMQLFFLVNYSSRYERNPFNSGGGGGSADYALMLVFGATLLLIINIFVGAYVLSTSLIYMVMYVWSCKEAEALVSVWGFTMQAKYFPWAMMVLNLLMSGTGALFFPFLGIAVGHTYYFLLEVFPLTAHMDLIITPKILIDFFGQGYNAGGAQAFVPPGRPGGGQGGGAGIGGGYNWGGGGRVLGAQ